MLQNLGDRIMSGVKTPEGKVIAILLVICLSLMTWNVAAISWAVSNDAAQEAAAQAEKEKKAVEEEAEANKPKATVAKEAEPEPEPEPAEESEPEPEEEPEPEPEPEEIGVEEPEPEPEEEPAVEEVPAEVDEVVVSDEGADEQEQFVQTEDEGQEQADEQEEEEAEEEAEEEKALEMPAQTFKGSANGVTVTVRAPEGALPANTKMHVSPVSAAQVIDAVEEAVNASAVAVKAVDITFTYTDDDGTVHEVEPARDIKVTMAASDIAAANGSDEQDVAVVHVADSGSADVVSLGASQNSVTFSSSEFSVYAIVIIEDESGETPGGEGDEPGETPGGEQGDGQEGEEAVLIDEEQDITSFRITYRFFLTDAAGSTSEYQVNGSSATQIVKVGDTLVQPQVPSLAEHEEFSGWYVQGTNQAAPFGRVDSIERNESVDIVGEINTVYYATLMNGRASESAAWPTLTVVKATADKGATSAVASVGSAAATSVNDDERFLGWSEDPSADAPQFPVGENLTLTDDVTLYPVFGKAYWLYFDENDGGVGGGASYTSPQYVDFGEAPTRPADPQRVGYSFTGWYADAECTTAFDFSKAYNEKTTAYAGWTKSKAAYTVIFWQQRVTDDKDAAEDAKTYDYKESVQRSSYTDEAVTPTSADLAKDYTGFHLNSTKTDAQATVAADGSTVLNVYYDRDLITMTFEGIGETGYTYTSTTSNSGTQYGYVNGEYVELTRVSNATYSYYYEVDSGWFGWGRTKVSYTGTLYSKKNSNYTAVSSDDGKSTYYGLVDGKYVELTRSTTTTYSYAYNGKAYDGVRYTRGSSTKRLIITGLYGQPLSMYDYSWPEGAWKYSSGNSTSGMTFLGEFILPDTGATSITFSSNGNVGGTINFYLQNPDGTYPDEPSDKGYSSSSSGTFNFTEKYNGFKVTAYQNNNSSGNGGSWTSTKSGGSAKYSSPFGIRYARYSYDIDFRNGSAGSIGTVSRLYEQSLSDVKAPATPSFPGNANEADMYEFVGWFADPECTTYVSFGEALSAGARADLQKNWNVNSFTTYESMPANNLVVYAGWMKKWFNVTLDAAGGELPQGQVDSFWVQYGDTVAGASLMQTVREGYTLSGWNVDSYDGDPWNFDAGVQGNLHLVARWTTGDDVSVAYDAGAGEGAPTDNALYSDGAKVTAKAAPTAPAGKVFVGWRVMRTDGTPGALCYPGQTFSIDQGCIVQGAESSYVQLVAEYVVYDVTAQISYSPNGGSGTIATQSIPVNKTSTLSLGEELSREGYTLVGWSLTSGDDNRVAFRLGGAVTVDKVNEESNVLYAVWAKNVVITATGAQRSAAYDATRQFNDDPAMTFEVAGEAVDELPAGITYEVAGVAAGVDVGSYDDELVIKVGSYDTNRYSVTTRTNNGRLTITKPKVNLTITGHTSSVTYDGQEHEIEGYEVTADSPLFNKADLLFAGEAKAARTEAGKAGMGLEAAQFSLAETSNVELGEVTVVDGYQEVIPAKVQVNITGATDTVTYNGKEQSVSGYAASISDPAYTESDFAFEGEATAAGTQAGVYAMGLSAGQFTNKNANYEPTFTIASDGCLTISPVDEVVVTITGANETATYDGNEHVASGYTFTASDPAYTEADFTFAGTAEVAATDAGYTPMGLASDQFANANDSFAKVTFVVTDGYVDIAKAQAVVTVVGDFPAAVTYDGAEHVAEGYTATSSNSVFDVERDMEALKTPEQMRIAKTDAGVYAMGLTEDDFRNLNSKNVDVTFVVKDGGLIIERITEKVTVTITGATADADYDGLEHSASGYTASASNPLYRTEAGEGGAVDFAYDGDQSVKATNAGTYSMGLLRSGFFNLNRNFANVEFVVNDGGLTIRKLSVSVAITGHSAEFEYTGARLSVEGFDMQTTSDLYTRDDFTVNGEAVASGVDAGTYAMGLARDRFVNLNENFDVTFSVTDGELVIAPVAHMVVVSIAGTSETKVYNGANQEATGYTVTAISDALYNESMFAFDGSANASAADVGEYPMGLAKEQFKNTSDNFAWVEFLVTDGKLAITPADVTVEVVGQQVSAVYNGEEHEAVGFEVFESSSSLYDPAANTTFTAAGGDEAQAPSVARTDAGTDYMGLSAGSFVNTNANFNVTYNVTDGYVAVTPLAVNVGIAGNAGSATYDGQAHVVEGWTAQADSALFDVADVVFSGEAAASQTEVGTAYMGLDASQFSCENANFDVAFSVARDGYSQVTPVDEVVVTIAGHTSTVVYDGQEHSVSGYDVQISSDVYTEADFTFAGTAEASQTTAGTANMGLAPEQFANTNTNFDKVTFEVADGYQTVTPRPVGVTVTGRTVAASYDGREHVASGYDVSISDELYTADDFTGPAQSAATAAQTHAGKVYMGLTSDQFVNTNENFAPVFAVTDGWASVAPIAVTVQVQGARAENDYDAYEHVASGYTITANVNEGLAEGEAPLFDVTGVKFTGSAQAARTRAGITNMGLAADQFQVADNADFSSVTFDVADGCQTIKPVRVEVTVTGATSTVPYDGEEHAVEGYEIDADVNAGRSADHLVFDPALVRCEIAAKASQTDAGTANMGLTASQFSCSDMANYSAVVFNVTDGYQTVTPISATVTVTGASNTADYDGAEHAVSGYELAFSTPLYTEADFTFAGTAEAARTNAGTANMGLAASQFVNTNRNFSNVTFSVTDGYQTIEPVKAQVSIVGARNTTTYDGAEHAVSGYVATADVNTAGDADGAGARMLYDCVNDIAFSGTALAARTDAGTTNMGLAAGQFANTNPNFSNVTFSVTDGYQTVTKRAVRVSVEGEKDSRPYTGDAQSVEGYKATTADDLYDTDEYISFTGEAVASGTDAGSYPMGLTAGQFANENDNFEVSFDVEDGNLTIVAADQVVVTITGKRAQGTYTGRPLTATGYDVKISDPRYTASDFSFSGTATATRTDAGTTNMGLDSSQFTNLDPTNFPDVVFVVEDGYVEVARATASVNIKGHTDQVVYDRAEHTVSGYDVSIESSTGAYAESDFALAEGVDATATGTNAGEYRMGLAEGTFGPGAATSQFTNTNPNYDVVFSVVDGLLTVTKQKVVVTVTGAVLSTEYDRTEHVVSGYTVQSSNAAFDVEADLVARVAPEDAKAAGVNAGTYAMGLMEGDFQNANSANVDMELRLTDGRLAITPVTEQVVVSIAGDTQTFVYDGNEHAASGFRASASNALYRTDAAEGAVDFSFTGEAAVKSTNAGSFDMGLSAEQFANVNPNFENVVFEVADGNLKISPVRVNVTITGNTLEAVYTGGTQSVEGYTFESDNELYREDDVSFTGSAIAQGSDAGTYAMGLSDDQFTNTNPNFDVVFVVTDSSLSIAPLQVEVSVAGHTATNAYDGAEHVVSGYDVKASSPLYESSYLSHAGDARAARTNAGTTDMGLAAEQFSNINRNFDVTEIAVTDGYQEITPVDEVVVTITGHSEEANYDGHEHVARGYDVSISNPLYAASDFEFTGEASAALTDAGTAGMGLTEEQFANVNANFENVEFRVTDGSVTVRPISATVTITGQNSTVTYDGAEHEVSGYTAVSSTPLYSVAGDAPDFSFAGEAAAARTDAGTANMGLTAGQFENTNSNFENVTFVVVDGYQTVTPASAKVTIVGHANAVDYDGVAHEVEGFDVDIEGELYTASDFEFAGNAHAARTDAGTTNMGLTAAQFVNTNANFADVAFTVTDGYQTVAPISATVTIVGANSTSVYDGGEHSVSGYVATADVNGVAGESGAEERALYDCVNDIAFMGLASAARTDAGTAYMGLVPEQFANTNPNFSNVTFIVTDGYARVTPLAVTVSVAGTTATKAYTGSEQEVSGYTVSANSALYNVDEDVAFTGEALARGTAAGSYPMGLSAGQFANSNNNFDVAFDVADGWLAIAPAGRVVVSVVGNSATGSYTGQPLAAAGYTLQFSDSRYTASHMTFTGEAQVSRTDAGRDAMGLSAEQFSNDDPVNFPNVVFAVTDGFVEVTPATAVVTIEGNRLSATYNGEEHVAEGFEARMTSSTGSYAESSFHLAEGLDATVAATNAGTYPMGLAEGTFGPGEAGPFVNDDANYDVTFIVSDGWLSIGKARATVTVTGKKLASVYDGTEHGVAGFTALSSNPLYRTEFAEADEAAGTPAVQADFTYAGNAAASGVDAGSYPMGIDAAQFANANPNFEDVEFIVNDGGLTIDPATVTVTVVGNTAKRAYTGEEQQVEGYRLEATNDLYTSDYVNFKGEALAQGENARARYNMGLSADQFSNANANFDVTFEVSDGWLEIEPINAVVKVTGNHDAVTYDGDEHSVSGYETSFSTPLYGEGDFEFTGKAEATRTEAGTTDMGLKAAQFANVNPNFDRVEFQVTDGYLTVVPAGDVVVTITGRSGSYDYDGTEHGVEGYDVEISDELYTVEDFEFAGDAAAVRTDVGTMPMGLTPGQFSNVNANFDNVTFNVVDGAVTVRPISATVTITGQNSTVTYDGAEHTVTGYAASSSTPLYAASGDAVDFTFAGEATAARTGAGTTNMGLAADQFENVNPNFENVTFEVTDGYQTVEKASAQVTIVGHTVTATYDGQTHVAEGYEEGISGELYTSDDFDFLGSAQVAGANAGSYAMGLAAEQFVNTNPNFADVVFNVTDGGLRIDPLAVQVSVTGAHAAVPYTGAEQSVEGYEAVADSELYDVARDVAFAGGARASGVRAGDYPMNLEAGQFANTNANFSVTFNVADGQLSIAPAGGVVVYITGREGSHVYDGEEFAVEGYDVQASDALYAEADIKFTGNARAALTDAGSVDMGLSAEQFANVNPDFTDVRFVVTDGHASVTPAQVSVTVTGNVEEAEYSGAEQRVEGFELASDNELYSLDDVVFSGEAAAVGTDAGTYPMGLAASQFTNANPNFSVEFNVADGRLVVTPVAEQVVVRLAGSTATRTYVGAEQAVSGYEVLEIGNPLYTAADFRLTGSDRAAGVNVGTYPMGLSAASFANANANFASVAFEVEDGWLQVTPAAVTVTVEGAHDALVFDGEEHVVSGFALSSSSELYDAQASTAFTPAAGAVLVGGEVAAVRTQAGTTNMGLASEQFANTDPNFEIEYVVSDGYLTIAPAGGVVVRVTGRAEQAVYDGEEHVAQGYDFEASDPLYTADDFAFTGEARAARTDAGTASMGLTPDQFANTSDDFEGVVFDVVDGSVTVTPATATVTITGNTATNVYDGVEHVVSGYAATSSTPLYAVEGDAAGFTFAGEARAARTDAGTTNMELSAGQFANVNPNFEGVVFDVTDGYQQITPNDEVVVQIVGHSDEVFYDGEEHSASGYDVQTSTPLYKVGDFTFAGEASAARTDAGTTSMGLVAEQFENTNPNFGTVTFEVTDGQMRVQPARVTVYVAGSRAEHDYDGEEHEVSGYELSLGESSALRTASDASALYDLASVSYSGDARVARTDAGMSSLVLDQADFANNDANFEVTFAVSDGSLKVNAIPATVHIAGAIDVAEYDGAEHAAQGYEVQGISSAGDLYTEADFAFEGEAAVARTDVGTAVMGLSAEQFANTNPNFDDVTFAVTDGWVQVTKKPVQLVSASDSKVYDGTPLTRHEVEGGEGFLESENVGYFFSGSQTEVGSSENTFAYVRTDALENNYDVTEAFGTLTVTEAPAGTEVVVPETAPALYTLTIDYRYAGGAQAAPSHVEELAEGARFSVDSPEIEGYLPDYRVLSGEMPAGDLTLSVTYVSQEQAPSTPAATNAPAATGAPSAPAAAAPAAPASAVVLDEPGPIAELNRTGEVSIGESGIPAVSSIDENENSLASGVEGSWSLFDVIATVITALIALILGIGLFGRKRKDDDDDDDDDPDNPDGSEAAAYATADEAAEEEDEEEDEGRVVKRRRALRILALIIGVAVIILLFLTQDFTQPMVLFDWWSIVFAIALVVQVIVAILARKKREDEDDDEDDDAQAEEGAPQPQAA